MQSLTLQIYRITELSLRTEGNTYSYSTRNERYETSRDESSADARCERRETSRDQSNADGLQKVEATVQQPLDLSHRVKAKFFASNNSCLQ